jgi:hypothetical protein
VVGRLVQQKQMRTDEQRPRQSNSHTPTTWR